MAPRKKRSSPPADESGLLPALKFVQLAQQDVGTVYQTHCRFLDNFVIAFNGVLAAGHPVTETMPICPHTFRLVSALERVNGAMSLTALDNKQLSIKADKFKALVSCIGDGDLTYIWPDASSWPLNDDFRKAAEIASLFTTEGGQTVVAASVVTRDHSIIGATSQIVIEAWHGIPTPPGLIIPKSFITALGKINKPIVKFGFSEQSFTVHFDNGAWLRTQLYQEQYPNVDGVLARTETAMPVPIAKDIFEGIKMVSPFAESAVLWISDGKMRSHVEDGIGATYELSGAKFETNFNYKYLAALEPYVTTIDFTGNTEIIAFFGNKMRGAMAKQRS